LFDPNPAHVALLDLQGVIVETNAAWKRFAVENGLPAHYECVGQNYLRLAEEAAGGQSLLAQEAYIGLLEVMCTRRPKFTMIYPCHAPGERRWYRMWVEPQTPAVPAVIVAHYLCATKPVVEAGEAAGLLPGQSVGPHYQAAGI